MSYILKIKVIPNSKEFKVYEQSSWNESLTIRLQSKAIKGQANQELVKKLTELLGSEVEIVKGKTSREKLVKVKGMTKEEALKLLKT